MSASPQGAFCPSCGRFVGPLDRCPHCGAAVHKRLPLRYIRLACILLAIAGIAALLYATRGSPTPRVTVASVGATMNYAYVRLEGQVTRGPTYDPEAQELRFYLADSTGEIMVASFRAVTRQLLDRNKIPVAGDHIAAEGTLRVRDDFTSLNLVSPDKIDLAHPLASPAKIGDIGPDDNLQVVSLSGQVREIRKPYDGLTLISLGDATGEINLAVYSDIVALTGPLPVVQVGDGIQATGTVSFYRDTPQIALTNVRDLIKSAATQDTATTTPKPVRKVTPTPVASERTIGSLSVNDQDMAVLLSARIAKMSPFSKGTRYTLDDGSGTITLLLWSDVMQGFRNAETLQVGAQLRVRGKIQIYDNDLELVPEKASDVTLLALSVLPTAAPRTIRSLKADEVGAVVIVRGAVKKLQEFSQGEYVTLADESGQIRVTLFNNVIAAMSTEERAALAEGAKLVVTGELSVYRGELELVPGAGGVHIDQ